MADFLIKPFYLCSIKYTWSNIKSFTIDLQYFYSTVEFSTPFMCSSGWLCQLALCQNVPSQCVSFVTAIFHPPFVCAAALPAHPSFVHHTVHRVTGINLITVFDRAGVVDSSLLPQFTSQYHPGTLPVFLILGIYSDSHQFQQGVMGTGPFG